MFIFKRKPRDFPNNDIISCVYIVYRNEVLFLKYNKTKSVNNVGKWTIISGKNNTDENEIECAIRELKEETGIEAKESDLTPVGVYYYKGNVNRKVYDYLLKINNKPKIILSDEHIDYRWVKMNEINSLELVRGRDEIIRYSKLSWMS